MTLRCYVRVRDWHSNILPFIGEKTEAQKSGSVPDKVAQQIGAKAQHGAQISLLCPQALPCDLPAPLSGPLQEAGMEHRMHFPSRPSLYLSGGPAGHRRLHLSSDS